MMLPWVAQQNLRLLLRWRLQMQMWSHLLHYICENGRKQQARFWDDFLAFSLLELLFYIMQAFMMNPRMAQPSGIPMIMLENVSGA